MDNPPPGNGRGVVYLFRPLCDMVKAAFEYSIMQYSIFRFARRQGGKTVATAEEVKEQLQRVTDAVGSVFFGKEEEIREILLGLVANGHVLLEDLPGTGKTTLAVAFSKVLSLDYRRVQFTPDLLPSDLTGFSVYDPERKEFVYREGAVFTNLLLADEINRTSPKTQAALLEVMEERQVTVEGTTRPLSAPFLVIGTQNPAGAVGTELLPEAEIDRFMISMSIGYPDEAAEVRMAEAVGAESPLKSLNSVLSQEDFLQVQEADATFHALVFQALGQEGREEVMVAQKIDDENPLPESGCREQVDVVQRQRRFLERAQGHQAHAFPVMHADAGGGKQFREPHGGRLQALESA